jgi:hypothetical protein
VSANKKTNTHRTKEKQVAAEKKTHARPHTAPQHSTTVTIDRRAKDDRRSAPDRRVQNHPMAEEHRTIERRTKVARRRQIDPTTCERDYSAEEIEFMAAIDEYKRRNGRMFPTCSEVLEVIKSLGYGKIPKIEPNVLPAVELPVAADQTATSIA